MPAGVTTDNLHSDTLADELIGNRGGSTVRVPVASIAQQMAATGPLAAAIGGKADGDALAALATEVGGKAPLAAITALEAQLDGLAEAITTNNITAETRAQLLTVAGMIDGQGAEVLDADSGSSPLATATGYNGASTPNAGRYRWVAAWSRWLWIGPTGLASKASMTQLVATDVALRTDMGAAPAHNLLSDAFLDWRDVGSLITDTGVVLARTEVSGRPALSVTKAVSGGASGFHLPPISISQFRTGKVSLAVEILSAEATASTGTANQLNLRQVAAGDLANTSVVNIPLALPTAAIVEPTWFRIENVTVDGGAQWMMARLRRNGADFVVGRIIICDGPVASERPTNAAAAIAAAVAAQRVDFNPRDLAQVPLAFGGGIGIFLGRSATGLQIGGSSAAPRVLVRTDGKFVAGRICVAEVTAKCLSSTTAELILAVGPGDLSDPSRRHIRWSSGSGAVAIEDGDGANSSSLMGAAAGRTIASGEVVTMRLERRADGTGTLTVTPASGIPESVALTGIPLGDVFAGARNSGGTGAVRYELQRCLVDSIADTGIDARLTAVEAAMSVGSIRSRGQRELPTPPALAGRTPPGWTCTGADRFDFGPFAGMLVAADDGRLIEGDASPYGRRLHILTPSFGRVLKTLSLGTITTSSAQGVAVDRGYVPGSLWVALPSGDNHIRHYEAPTGDLDGSEVAAVEITGDAISWSALGLIGSPNGLAFDSDDGGALWAATASAATAYQIACDPAASPRILRSITLGSAAPDQLQYLSAAQMRDGQARLIYTVGSNGSNGAVRVYNLATDQDAAWATLPGSRAIEQAFYDPATNILWSLNDRGFHAAGTGPGDPAINNVQWYDMPPLPV